MSITEGDSVMGKWPNLITAESIDYEKVYANFADNLEGNKEFSDNYYNWVASSLRPYLGKRTLEIGAGSGLIADQMLSMAEFDIYMATEVYGPFVEELKIISARRGGKLTVKQINAVKLHESEKELVEYNFDSVFSTNFLEHIEDDVEILKSMSRVVPKGGRVVNFVPALRSLYGSADQNLGHFRRYEKSELREKMEAAGLEVENLYFFNMAGYMAWLAHNLIPKSKDSTKGQLRLFDKFVPIFKLIERVIPCPFGSTLVAVGRVSIR